MMSIPDHPVIRNMERTGSPDGKDPSYPVCPICGQECETIYTDSKGIIEGCEGCLTRKDAWEVPACFPERRIEV